MISIVTDSNESATIHESATIFISVNVVLICKFYVVKGYGGNLLGKESAEQLNLLRVGPPENIINAVSYSELSDEDTKKYAHYPELQAVLDEHKNVFQRIRNNNN